MSIIKLFSARHGYTSPKSFQKEEMDRNLRNGLWNVFFVSFSENFDGPRASHAIYEVVFANFLKQPLDKYNKYRIEENNAFVKRVYMFGKFHEVFDLIEFVTLCLSNDTETKDGFVRACNNVLIQENSAYKIVGDRVTSITEEHEIAEIETAMQAHGPAKEHIKKAYVLFSDRKNPHYENSIKESIHAVESIAKEITGKTDKPLNALTQQLKLHPNLTNALNELYNWTSKDGGIRHSKSEKSLTPDQATARYMLVTCSAFVNYIIARNQPK